jgi:uncharacterized membrane protein YkvI
MTATRFQRFILPGLAFKAIVIGGGYATGRELAEFFVPAGPYGGLAGMLIATAIWSIIAALTFVYARRHASHDYRTFFKSLLGRGWPLFEVAYFLSIVVILSVFGAASAAIASGTFGLPESVGMTLFVGGIVLFSTLGNQAVEGLFKYVSVLLYATYAIFMVLALSTFGERIAEAFATVTPMDGWIDGGLAYAGYNIVGATLILPLLRHFTSDRDAVMAGLLCGPIAMIPAILFFICMAAYFPAIGTEPIPSDYLLNRLQMPLFHALFQLMIFAALLESGTGFVHAVNERLSHSICGGPSSWGRMPRFWIAVALCAVCVFFAARFGIVALIARGYRFLSYLFIAIYIVPLLTFGLWRIVDRRSATAATAP